MPTQELFLPPYLVSLEKMDIPQVRLGIQGFGGTGKTWSALTFPNPVVLNLDKGLGAHRGKKDVYELKFNDQQWVKEKLNKPTYKPYQLIEVIIDWLTTDALKLTPEQTLVFDGNTGWQNAYHLWYSKNQVVSSSSGKLDQYAEWRLKIKWYGELCELFKTLQCHVVFLMHESPDGDGGKVRPLIRGQFRDEILGHFTDFFRQLAQDKKPIDKIDEDKLKLWKMTKTEFINMQDSYDGNTLYFWQTESDDIFDAKASSLFNRPRFIPADFESFKKWMRK